MDREIIEDNHITPAQCRAEHLVDTRTKGHGVEWAIEHDRRMETLQP
jgi:hypothetical protein